MPAKPTPPAEDATEIKAHEAAWLTGLNATTVYKMIARGELDAKWKGGRVRVSRASVNAYLAEREKSAA